MDPTDMEKFSAMIAAYLHSMKEKEMEENRKKEVLGRTTKCLHSVLTKQGEFDGRSVTRYLKGYWMEATINKIDGEVAVKEFVTLVEPELKETITSLAKGATGEKAWSTFESRMKEEFQLEDPDRVTQASFLDWVADRSKRLGPQELMREFVKKFNQLPEIGSEIIKVQKATLFIRSADEKLQDELELALELMNPSRGACQPTWEEVETAVLRVSQKHRRKKLNHEGVLDVVAPVASLRRVEKVESTTGRGEKKVDKIDELSELMKNLTVLATQAFEKIGGNTSQPASRGGGGASSSIGGARSWNCIWCDDKNHVRRDCADLSLALKERLVKFVEHDGIRKLAYHDSGELIPLNNNKGGMKVLVEKRMVEHHTSAIAAAFGDEHEHEADVYTLFGNSSSEEVVKKRLAETVRRKSGWDDPVLISSFTAEVGSLWDSMVEEKRKSSDPLEERAKGKQKVDLGSSTPRPPPKAPIRRSVRFEDTRSTTNESTSTPSSSREPEVAKKERAEKKGPGWVLGRDVEQHIEYNQVADKFWKAEVSGVTNEEFFACMNSKAQDALLAKVKRKRFYKEGPHALGMEAFLDGEDDGEELYVSQANLECEVYQVNVEKIPRPEMLGSSKEEALEPEMSRAKALEESESLAKETLQPVMLDGVAKITQEEVHKASQSVWVMCAAAMKDPNLEEEILEPFWARTCSVVEIELVGMKGKARALIDTGSEVNLMSRSIYELGQWMVDCDTQWSVNSINRAKNTLWGGCPGVPVKVGNVIEPTNIFVHESLPYDLILGQPYITQARLEYKVLPDGTHMAKVRSRDDLRVIQFPVVKPGHWRNRKELRGIDSKEGLEDFRRASR